MTGKIVSGFEIPRKIIVTTAKELKLKDVLNLSEFLHANTVLKTLSLNVDGREYKTGMTVVLSVDEGVPAFAKIVWFVNIKNCWQFLAEKFEVLEFEHHVLFIQCDTKEKGKMCTVY